MRLLMNRTFISIIQRGNVFRKSHSTKSAYLQYSGDTPLLYRTLGEHIEICAEKFHNREALVASQENKRLTFSDAINLADILAAKFRNLELQRGDHIAIWAPNTFQWYISFLAAARSGLVVACLNPSLQATELKYCLKKAKVKALITPEIIKTQKHYEILKGIIPEIDNTAPAKNINSIDLPFLKSIVIDSEHSNLPGAYKFKDLLQQDKNIEKFQYPVELQPDDPCNIQFTSGTTGLPKAAVLSNFSFVNLSEFYRQRAGFQSNDKILCQIPLFHAFGLITLIASLTSGITLVLPSPTFDSEQTLKTIEKEKCSVILGAPTMFVDNIQKQKKLNCNLDSLRIGITGGAACSPQIFKEAKELFGISKMFNGYGLSEATCGVFMHYGNEDEETQTNTVGKLFNHLESKIIDDNGKIVEFGKPGELCIRGYTTLIEYFEDETKTNEVLSKDGWLRTGDEFILNESGYAQVVGRKKEMIIRGGENIFPKEIEDFLDSHPDILESQIIGVPDHRMGEELCAFLRLRSDIPNLTQSDIKEYSKGKISHFKVPRFVHIVKEFPKTTSGKVQKFKLKEMFNQLNMPK